MSLNETAEKAILREIKEELEIDAKIVRPLWLNQGFFVEDVTGEKYHELCIYFLIDISNTDLLEKGNKFRLIERAVSYKHLQEVQEKQQVSFLQEASQWPVSYTHLFNFGGSNDFRGKEFK